MATKVEEVASQVDGLFDAEEIEVPGPKQPRAPILVPPRPPQPPQPLQYDEEEQMTMPPEPAAPPPKRNGRTPRSTAPVPASTAKIAAPRIAKFLPDAEHVKIFKVDMGHRRYIKTYSAKDLARSPDIEVFIQQHVMPIAEEGEYDVDVIDAKGDLKRTVNVSVIDPNKPPPGMSGVHVQESMVLSKFLDRVDKLEAAALAPPPASKTFAEQIQEIAQVKGMLGIDEKKGGSDITPMLMMMMMQRPQDVPVTSKTALDFAELKADLKAMRDRDMYPQHIPLPAPIPMPDPNTGLAEIVKAMAEMNRKEEPPLRITDLIPLLKPDKPAWGITEIGAVIGLVTPLIDRVFGDRRNPDMDYLKEQIRDLKADQRSGGKGIQETLADVSAIVGLARNLTGGGGEESNFWTFANKLIDNGAGFVDSLGTMMNSIRTDEKKQLPSGSTKEESPDKSESDDSDELPFPDGFDAMVEKIAGAKDSAERCGTTLLAFQFLGQKSQNWRKYLSQVVQLAKDDKKDEVMEFLVSFLEALVERELLTDAICKATIKAFDEHYERAVEVLTGGAKPAKKE